MNLLIDGKSVTLAPWQLEKISREQTRRELEEKASNLLAAWLQDPASLDASLLTLDAVYSPWHVDYLSDRIAARFLRIRRDTVTDAATWKKAIRQELTARKKQFSHLPDNSEQGRWLLRPVDALLQLLWRCQYAQDPVDFCLDESVFGQPKMVYHASFTESDGLLYFHMAGPHSRFMHLLDDGTARTYLYEDFAQAIEELLAEDLQHLGRKLPKYLWVYQ